MAASYPTTAKTFTPIVDAVDYPQAAQVNQIYDEVAAIEAALLGGLAHPLRFAAAPTLTIAGGVVTVTKGYSAIDTEAAAAADDLDTITPGANVGEGSVIILRAANTARVVTLKDGTGNLLLMGDFALSTTDRSITLYYDGTNWRELARSGPPQPRVVGTTTSATPTPNVDTTDTYALTALAEAAAFGAPTGTPFNGQKLLIRIKDNGTARALTWNAAYVAGGVALPSTTVLSKILYVGFIYNTDNALNKWQCVGTAQEA